MQEPITDPTNRQPATTVTTPRRQVVSQTTLAEILKRRREIKGAEKAVKHDLGVREEAVIKAIESGAIVVLGILTAEVRHEERRNVAWRKVAEEYLGSDFCELVVEETEPATYTKLVIA